MKVSFSDKIVFAKAAFKRNLGPLGIGLLFIALGIVVIYIASFVNEGKVFLHIFGGVFIVFPLFFLLFTMPSSFLFYYEKALIKKYGSYGTAFICGKAILDSSSLENKDARTVKKAQRHFELTYEYEYLQVLYTNTFHVASRSCFDRLPIGGRIPIQFLKVKPSQSTVRRAKLSNELGIDRKDCT
ncbi:MAG: hypothetical protein K0U54_10585 [Bacteroidetes bacterium]|nr:hypothetical protein [Bacteroidota bacterium]